MFWWAILAAVAIIVALSWLGAILVKGGLNIGGEDEGGFFPGIHHRPDDHDVSGH
ncbi:MAG TPA: hypothetical protein VG983_04095 [Caulobacterales bacterium]|jgi:hypothetical protein|nr:hypothetical protein [Caulobacterales bacterium]